MATDKTETNAVHIYTPPHGTSSIEVERGTIRTYENGDKWPVRNSTTRVRRTRAELVGVPLPTGPITLTTCDELIDYVIATFADAMHADEIQRRDRERKRVEAANAEYQARAKASAAEAISANTKPDPNP